MKAYNVLNIKIPLETGEHLSSLMKVYGTKTNVVIEAIEQLYRRTTASPEEHSEPSKQETKPRTRRKGGIARYGYRWDVSLQEYVEEPDEQVILGFIVDCRKDGDGSTKIARKLNDKGYLSRSGKAWKSGSVDTIIRSIEGRR